MGETRTYRWERRRKRLAGQKAWRAMSSFWLFELILIILIFTLWLVGARLLLVHAITQSACAEMAASFGQAEFGLPLFDLLFWLSVLMGVFWAAIAIAHRPVLRRKVNMFFHVILLGCILLLMANFRMMHLEDNIRPDGTLGTVRMVLDEASGAPQYFPLEEPGQAYRFWQIGDFDNRQHGQELTEQRCVWLDRNLIQDSVTFLDRKTYIEIPGYGAMTSQERQDYYDVYRRNRQIYSIGPWYQMSALEMLHGFKILVFTEDTGMSILRDRQIYRSMTVEERVRFIDKQACFKTQFDVYPAKDCTDRLLFDSSQYWLDQEMDKLGVTKRTLRGN